MLWNNTVSIVLVAWISITNPLKINLQVTIWSFWIRVASLKTERVSSNGRLTWLSDQFIIERDEILKETIEKKFASRVFYLFDNQMKNSNWFKQWSYTRTSVYLSNDGYFVVFLFECTMYSGWLLLTRVTRKLTGEVYISLIDTVFF